MRKRFYDEECQEAFYHLIIRVPEHTYGQTEFAFQEDHKLYFENLLFKLEGIYCLKMVSYCIMSTHVHIILSRDNNAHKELSLIETAKRYKKYYKLKVAPDARCAAVRKFRIQLNNLSEFMRDLQRRFTFWYNNKSGIERHGSLWHPRFKSVSLTSLKALLECMKYVELNPVRAKMVKAPGEYRFCSWGHICKSDPRGIFLKRRIVAGIRYFKTLENKHLSDNKIFRHYAGDLEALAYYVKNNKNVKSIEPYVKSHLLSNSKLWSNLKAIGGEHYPVGQSYGNRRPRTIMFRME